VRGIAAAFPDDSGAWSNAAERRRSGCMTCGTAPLRSLWRPASTSRSSLSNSATPPLPSPATPPERGQTAAPQRSQCRCEEDLPPATQERM